MRFLVDECTGPAASRWLDEQGQDVCSAYDLARGADDETIIQKAVGEGRILITNDKDFGQMFFRDGRVHSGVILLQMEDERPKAKIAVLKSLLKNYPDRIEGQFLIVSEEIIRIARGDSG